MKIPFIDLKLQYNSIKYEIQPAIEDILENTAFIKGKEVERFENDFAALLGVKHCIGVGNGTDALVISLKALGIGPGDEVIVPANSFIATSEAVTVVGAHPIFVDNDPESYNIDIEKIEAVITSHTKAIIPGHLYGRMAPMENILEIALRYDLKIIEDSSQAHFSEMKTENGIYVKAGTIGDFGTFSFYPGKNLGAYGDAGAIVTNNSEYARYARMYSNHGRISKYNHEFEGINSRLDNLQAAVLNIKLRHILDWTEGRREIAKLYDRLLSHIPNFTLPVIDDKYKSSWHLYVVRTPHRDLLRSFLINHGISTGIHYPIPLPFLEAYSELNAVKEDFPCAYAYQNEILSLPIYPELTNAQIEFCCEKIKTFHQ